jgi:putative flippase GtrA
MIIIFSMLRNLIIKYKFFIKYIIAGMTAAAVDIFLLFIFTDYAHIWYLASSALAFIISFFVGFALQKFWTFGCRDLNAIYKQGFFYLITGFFCLALNSAGLYVFVDHLHIHYIIAQILTGGIVALFSFSFSYFITFRDVVAERNSIETNE